MTVEEFKNKYPEQAHLEGNALWDAMTHPLFLDGVNEPLVVKDWKGNVVKAGDEICLIKTTTSNGFGQGFILVPRGASETGKAYEIPLPYTPPTEAWEIGEYIKVESSRGELMYKTKTGEHTILEPISSLLFFMDESRYVLAIKGLSDTNQ